MDIEQYLRQREDRERLRRQFRDVCGACFMPRSICYCHHIRSFDPKIKFVILIHPLEIRRKIASGRMAHLCLENSALFRGQEFNGCEPLDDILRSDVYEPVVLFPGPTSLNLSTATADQRAQVFKDKARTPLIVVADGTWATAKKTVRRSNNLCDLPRVCFTPRAPSQFRVRKQPKPECVSSIEAIHETLELLGPSIGFDVPGRAHDNLLFVFDKMVEQQLHFVENSRSQLSRYAQARAERIVS